MDVSCFFETFVIKTQKTRISAKYLCYAKDWVTTDVFMYFSITVDLNVGAKNGNVLFFLVHYSAHPRDICHMNYYSSCFIILLIQEMCVV